ncbi:MAG: hypothetical protein JST93_29995 [Acidobacteria bacterium]|nr:hypothetical protein [Acidobacteriota bacterium]
MTPKSPHIAAVLSLLFGPLGFLYIGWKFAVCGFSAIVLFVAADWLIGLPIATPGRYIILPVFAWKGATITALLNKCKGDAPRQFHTFPMAILASTDLLVGLAMCFAGAVAVYEGASRIRNGETGEGLAVLALGAPIAIQIAGLIFDIIASTIDSWVMSHFPGTKNIFRHKSRPLTGRNAGKA